MTEINITGKHIVLYLVIIIVLIFIIIAFSTPNMFHHFKSGLNKISGGTILNQDDDNDRIIRIGFEDYGAIFKIPRDQINKDFRKDRKRTESEEYLTPTNPHIIDFANQLRDSAIKNRNDTILYIIDFVQTLPYENDTLVGFDDYPKYPTETLFERRGDCEDTSYLLYSLLEALGYDVVLIFIPRHVMAGIACSECPGWSQPFHDKKYYFIETTNTGFFIGDFPHDKEQITQEVIKTDGTDNYKSIKCFKEKINYNVKEEYWVDVPYIEKVDYDVDVPIEKTVELKYSILDKTQKKLGWNDCLFTYGVGMNCYELQFSLRNDDDVDGIFRYIYEVDGTEHSQTFKEREMGVKAGETKKAEYVVFDTKGNEQIESFDVKVAPSTKKVTEFKKEKRVKEIQKTRKEKRTKMITKHYYKNRCV